MLKGLEKWKEGEKFPLSKQVSESSWVLSTGCHKSYNPTQTVEETCESSAGGTQELLSVEGNNLAYN